MIADILKIASEEPEKIEASILRGVKILLNILIAGGLFKTIIGPFEIFPLSSYKAWADFVLSGQVFICILFYFVSDYIICPALPLPWRGLAILFSRKIKFVVEKDDLRGVLKYWSVIDFGERNNMPRPGRNFHLVEDFVQLFETKDSRDEVYKIQNSFISNVLNLYSIFFALYFIAFPLHLRGKLLDFAIVGLLLLIVVLYLGLFYFIEYMMNNYQKINILVTAIKSNFLVFNILAEYHIFPVKPEMTENISKCVVFQRNGKEYVIAPFLFVKPETSDNIERMLKNKAKDDRIFLIIQKGGFLTNIDKLLLLHSDSLIIIQYNNETDLEQKIRQTIEAIL